MFLWLASKRQLYFASVVTPGGQWNAYLSPVQLHENSFVCPIERADNTIYIFYQNFRDTLSAVLAEKHGITSKAVRDVWKLRTWAWVTMPYWTQDDIDTFLTKHLCASCRKKGVTSWQVRVISGFDLKAIASLT